MKSEVLAPAVIAAAAGLVYVLVSTFVPLWFGPRRQLTLLKHEAELLRSLPEDSNYREALRSALEDRLASYLKAHLDEQERQAEVMRGIWTPSRNNLRIILLVLVLYWFGSMILLSQNDSVLVYIALVLGMLAAAFLVMYVQASRAFKRRSELSVD